MFSSYFSTETLVTDAATLQAPVGHAFPDQVDYRNLKGKRVGFVVLSSYPQDPRPRRVAETFVDQGMEVDYICVNDGNAPARETRDGMNLFRIPISHRRGGKLGYFTEYSAFILASAGILAARSLQRRYDLVYVNNMPDILVCSALLPKMFGAKVILDLHDPMPELMTTIFGAKPESKTIGFIKWMEKWSMARAHALITVNLACRRIFSARSCPPEKISVVMNSPDSEIFPFRSAQSRPPVPDPTRPYIVMYHGSLVERNGVDLAVEAVARIRERVPNIQLHIYGRSTPFGEKVMRTVRDRGLENTVFYKGQKSLEGIVQAIAGCDVGVIPNHRNSFTDINTPTRIFEYLALGKPVISPRTPGIQDYFDDSSLLYFQSGNAEHLAGRILFAAAHPDEALNIAERGQRVYELHRWERERETVLTVVDNLLAEAKTI